RYPSRLLQRLCPKQVWQLGGRRVRPYHNRIENAAYGAHRSAPLPLHGEGRTREHESLADPGKYQLYPADLDLADEALYRLRPAGNRGMRLDRRLHKDRSAA